MGDKAHSKEFSEDAYKRAAEPKELYIVQNAGHVDLYDKVEMIPFNVLTSFFNEHLNQEKRNAIGKGEKALARDSK
jgi:uncharacterized protein